MDAFEAYFTSLKDQKIAVLGLGVSNRPLVRLLLEFGCRVTGCDRTPREKLDAEVLELEKLGAKLSLGDGYLDGVEANVLFRTPGMHPGNPAIQALRDRGAKVTSEMEVFFEVCPCTLIAVTGSDGKTTTTTLVSEMLKASGKTVWQASCFASASAFAIGSFVISYTSPRAVPAITVIAVRINVFFNILFIIFLLLYRMVLEE